MSVRGVPRYVGESDLAYHDRVVDLFARMAKLHVDMYAKDTIADARNQISDEEIRVQNLWTLFAEHGVLSAEAFAFAVRRGWDYERAQFEDSFSLE